VSCEGSLTENWKVRTGPFCRAGLDTETVDRGSRKLGKGGGGGTKKAAGAKAKRGGKALSICFLTKNIKTRGRGLPERFSAVSKILESGDMREGVGGPAGGGDVDPVADFEGAERSRDQFPFAKRKIALVESGKSEKKTHSVRYSGMRWH